MSERRGNVVTDSWVVARRSLMHMRRQPEALVDVTLQPVMFVLLFAYVSVARSWWPTVATASS